MPEKILIKYKNGLQEALTFEPLSNTELYKFIDHLVTGETPAIVALNTRRSIEWVNSLDLDCFLDLASQFVKENFQLAMRIAMRDPIAGLKVGPLLAEMGRVLSLIPGMPSALTLAPAAPSGTISPTEPAPAASPGATPAPATLTVPAPSAGS
jgi:hypothetical protein